MTPSNFNEVNQRPDFGGIAQKKQVVIQPVILQFTAKLVNGKAVVIQPVIWQISAKLEITTLVVSKPNIFQGPTKQGIFLKSRNISYSRG